MCAHRIKVSARYNLTPAPILRDVALLVYEDARKKCARVPVA